MLIETYHIFISYAYSFFGIDISVVSVSFFVAKSIGWELNIE